MSDSNKLKELGQAIDNLGSTLPNTGNEDIDVRSLAASSPIVDQLGGDQAQTVQEIQKGLADLSIPGLDLKALDSFGDCFKDIDEILMSKVQAKAFEALDNSDILGMEQAQNVVAALADSVQSVLGSTLGAVQKQLGEQLSDIQKLAGPAKEQALAVFAKANGIASDALATLDPCNIPGVAAQLSTPQKGNARVAPPLKPSPLVINKPGMESLDKYQDTMFRISDIVNDMSLDLPRENRLSAQSALDRIARQTHTDTCTGNCTHPIADLIKQEISNNARSWDVSTMTEFIARTSGLTTLFEKESHVITSFTAARTPIVKQDGGFASDSILSSGTLGLTGISLYGGYDWNYVNFMRLRKSDRSPELVKYWSDEQGRNIEQDEIAMRKAGIQIGLFNIEDILEGLYGEQHESGKTCSTTRFPGDTILQLKNVDGSIFDPAGINPSGLVKVVDADAQPRLFNTIDLFITEDVLKTYRQHPLHAVIVEVYSMGSKKSKYYGEAHINNTDE